MTMILEMAALAAPYVAVFLALMIFWLENLSDDLIEHLDDLIEHFDELSTDSDIRTHN